LNRNFAPDRGLFYEKEVSSFSALAKCLRILDEDSGIRVIGVRGGNMCMVFITRFGPKYTMMTYSMKRGAEVPARRLETLETDSIEALETALKRITAGGVRAYVY
jgi:hypothetical protein